MISINLTKKIFIMGLTLFVTSSNANFTFKDVYNFMFNGINFHKTTIDVTGVKSQPNTRKDYIEINEAFEDRYGRCQVELYHIDRTKVQQNRRFPFIKKVCDDIEYGPPSFLTISYNLVPFDTLISAVGITGLYYGYKYYSSKQG